MSFDWENDPVFSESAFGYFRNVSDKRALAAGCWFDWKAGQRVCRWIEMFARQSKGAWAGQPLTLLPWQRDQIMRAFGWKRPDGTRRFRTVYCEVPKKQGKSTLVSALSLYLALSDNEPAAEIYLNAVDRQQADVVFEEACRMTESSPDFACRLKIGRHLGIITDPKSYSRIVKNSAEAPSKDGVNASAVVFDELARFKTRELFDIFTYAGISRRQPIRIVITTAGESAEGPWHDMRKKTEDVASGTVDDDTFLGYACYAKETEDLDDHALWYRVNPSLGHTISLDEFQRSYDSAKAAGGAEWANFLRLRLGVILRSEGQYIALADWDKCGTGREDPDDDTPMYIGLDLSQRDDLTAMVAIWGNLVDGFNVGARFWLPEEQISVLESKHGAPYRAWAAEEFMELTPGPTIKYDFIKKSILKFATEYNVVKIYSDPYNAESLANDLANEGLPIEFLSQVWSNLSDATKTLKELVLSGRLRHTGNPVMRWNVANAIAKIDSNGNVRLDKAKSRMKIDGLSALVNAITAAIRTPPEEASVYEMPGQLML